MPLALLHAILVQQSYFGHQAFVTQKLWTLNDLVTAVDILQSLNSWTSDKLALADVIGQVYTRHCEVSQSHHGLFLCQTQLLFF